MAFKKAAIVVGVYYAGLFLVRIYLFNEPGIDIRFINLRQGSAVLINSGNSFKALINAASPEEIEEILLQYYLFPVCNIDAVYLTNARSENLDGVLPCLQKCKIGALLINDISQPSHTGSSVSRKLDEIKSLINFRAVKFNSNQTIKGLLKIVRAGADKNILLADYKNFEVLFTDGEGFENVSEVELKQLQAKIQNGLDVVSFIYRGTRSSVTPELVEKVSLLEPKTCVLQVESGKGYKYLDYTLSLLQKLPCRIRRTDREGTIEFKVN